MGHSMSKCEAAGDLPPLPEVGALPPAEASEAEAPSLASLTSALAPASESTVKAPGQFERLHEDVKKVVNVNTFEGAKFDLAKPLTPMFAVNHSVWLGGSHYPQANSHYKFGVTVGDNERVCIASMDQYGTLEGQVYASLARNNLLQGKLIFNLPADASAGAVSVCDVDYNGPNANAQLKVANNVHGQQGLHLGWSYMQALTSKLAMGGEGACNMDAPSASISAAAKYALTKKATATATYTKSTAQGGNDTVQLHYHHAVSNRVNLGSELVFAPQTMDSQFLTGAEFALKQSKLNLAVDGAGKMSSVLETQMSPAAKFALSAELQFGPKDESGKHRDHYKFGYALQIGQ